MENSIINKINDEIASGIDKECQVVYIMIELRKLLDMQRDSGNDKYKIIRFYSDWIVHTKKSTITSEIKEIMNKIDSEIPLNYKEDVSWQIYQKELMKFIYMESLKDELDEFFKEVGINNVLLEKSNWIKLISLLVKILEEQPILNPTNNVNYFLFEPAANGAVIWIIEFNDVRGTMRFGNMY